MSYAPVRLGAVQTKGDAGREDQTGRRGRRPLRTRSLLVRTKGDAGREDQTFFDSAFPAKNTREGSKTAVFSGVLVINSPFMDFSEGRFLLGILKGWFLFRKKTPLKPLCFYSNFKLTIS